LDPDSGVASAAVHMARMHRRADYAKTIKASREALFVGALNDVENQKGAGAIEGGIDIDPDRLKIASKRSPLSPITLGRAGEKEKAIERKLSTPTSLNFEHAPLKTVIGDLRDVHGINIVEDIPALQEEGISLDSPVSIKLDQVSLKSALNLILGQVG